MKKNFIFLIAFIFYLTSCATELKITPEEARYPKIIAEKAYTEFNNKKYKRAIKYYQYIIDNFDRENYSKEVQEIYDEAQIYHDGKWIMFEPVDTSLFHDFIRLLRMKRKPNKK